ncbi:hypothetical protein DSL72_005164 [Monilinia vaccinii-corymbosi]|uniref:Myb-like domain-containing protein n=1 Tax=Monilinia vaccinii-corymbosi TaxID=61207 RepID=A0A8A3PEY1_9HELO|nr:hypothetical protein DSL72_005164 [Monilinia vaccinii-corymbosi]
MTETNCRQTDSPSGNLSPDITTPKTPLTTAQPSSDNKSSRAQTPVDPLIMDQDPTEVSEEHGGAYMSISQGKIGTSNVHSQKLLVAGHQSAHQGAPVGQNIRRRANQFKVGDEEVRRSKRQLQQRDDSGDEAQESVIGRARRDIGRYSDSFLGSSDDRDFDTMDPMEIAYRGHGNLDAFSSPSAGRNFRRIPGRNQQEQRDSRNERQVLGRPQQNVYGGGDLGAVDSNREDDGYVPRQFQRVTLSAGLPEPRFPVVKGRVVKQTSRRGDPPPISVSDDKDAGSENSDFQDSSMDDEEYDDYARYAQGVNPDYGTPIIEDEEYGEDEAENTFVPEPSFRRPNRAKKNRAGVSQPTGARPTAKNTATGVSGRSHPAVARRDKDAEKPRIILNSPSQSLAPSRYSGAVMPWGVNQQPVLVDQDTVSDAHLKKRGLTRPPPGEKVGKRSYGANDPENVAIVNMKENDRMSFAEIAEALNLKRVEMGRAPALTVCGVNGRYNRTAPILFAIQGLNFVPLSERKKAGGAKAHGSSTSKSGWTAEAENRLVEIVKQVEAEKWKHVAQMLNADLYNGRAIHDATACARRYAAL